MSTTQVLLVAVPAGVALAAIALVGVAIRARRKLELEQLRAAAARDLRAERESRPKTDAL